MKGLMWFDVHLIEGVSGIECHKVPVINCRAAEFMLLFVYLLKTDGVVVQI